MKVQERVIIDEFLDALTPSLFQWGNAQLETTLSAQDIAQFNNDREWFATNKKRRLLLRRSTRFSGWDACITDTKNTELSILQMTAPKLWLLIVQCSEGTHLALPVYRGEAFWPQNATEPEVGCVNSDTEVAGLLFECQIRGGLDSAQFSEWFAKYQAALTNPSTTSPKQNGWNIQ